MDFHLHPAGFCGIAPAAIYTYARKNYNATAWQYLFKVGSAQEN